MCKLRSEHLFKVFVVCVCLLDEYLLYFYFVKKWFTTDDPKHQLISYLSLDAQGSVVFGVLQLLFLFLLISYFSAGLIDPGFVKSMKPPEPNLMHPDMIRNCKHCLQWKPGRAKHCKDCRRCVFRMDHHCIWIDNCVGIRNEKLFILFLFYSMVLCVLTCALLLLSIIFYFQSDTPLFVMLDLSLGKFFCLMILLVCLILGYFSLDFLRDFYESIELNQTEDEQEKQLYGVRHTFMQNFK